MLFIAIFIITNNFSFQNCRSACGLYYVFNIPGQDFSSPEMLLEALFEDENLRMLSDSVSDSDSYSGSIGSEIFK